MKNLNIIFDDRERPSDEIREITGEKSFGRIIYKRRRLRDIFASEVTDALEKEKIKADLSFRSDFYSGEPELSLRNAVVLVFSSCIVKDPAEFSLLLKKAGYCKEDYKVLSGNRIAAVIYRDTESYLNAAGDGCDSIVLRQKAEELEEISSGAFLDISVKEQFLSFITGGFDARYFNALSGDEYTVIKKSSNVDKIRSEYRFYYLLPDNMRSWFVLPYDYEEKDGEASYRMQRYHMTDLAIRYVHGSISAEEFKKILDILFVFLKERKEERVTWNEFYEKRRDLYIMKVESRIEEFKKHPDFAKIENHIVSGTPYQGIDAVLKRYEDLYDSMIGSTKEELRKTVCHGDLCFSNILYSPEAGLLRLIDPKGAEKEEELYSDPLYDIAKLSHSIAGQYDFMNSGLYEIDVEDDMKLKLKVDGDVSVYRSLFDDKLKEAGIDLRMVRLFECSLFLSMLPLHTDRPQKVLAFILNAIDIMDELEKKK